MGIVILSMLRASDFALIAIGFALVFGSCRVLNLMHGSFVMLGGDAAYWFSALIIPRLGSSPPALGLAVLLAAATTALLGYTFFKLLQVTNRAQPQHVLVISIAGNLFLSRAVAYRWGVEGLNVPRIVDGTLVLGNMTLPAADVLRFIAAVLLIAGLWLWLNRSQSGRALRAVADNAPTSQSPQQPLDPASVPRPFRQVGSDMVEERHMAAEPLRDHVERHPPRPLQCLLLTNNVRSQSNPL